MAFDYALVGACPLQFNRYTGLRHKKAVDRQVVQNLKFLRYGKLPTFQLTREAREIFWTYTCFQVDWVGLCTFALGFEIASENEALFVVPHGHIRRIRIDIYTEAMCPKIEDRDIMDSLSGTLRRLIEFPVLQRIEIVVQMPVLRDNDKLICYRVSQIQCVCRKLSAKFGSGFTVVAERSAFGSYEDEPYPWEESKVFEQDAETKEGPEEASVLSDDDDTFHTSSDPEEGSEDVNVMFQRQNLTWIWMPPTEKTSIDVAKGGGTWMERTNVHLFEKKPVHEQDGYPL